MKKVTPTIRPSLKQIQNMCFNLQEVFHDYVSMQIEHNCHSSTNKNTKFIIYRGDIGRHDYFYSWSDLLDEYYKLMEIHHG